MSHPTDTPAISVGLIGHLETPQRYQSVLHAARGDDLPLPDLAEVSRLVNKLTPFPVTDARFVSARGLVVRARYVDLCYLVEAEVPLKAGLQRVRQACRHVQRSGAKVAALGGFASILGEMGAADLSAEFGLAFTTGNALTAGTLAAQVCAHVHEDAELVVVGAGGDVGSGLCRVLSAGGRRLVLVGRNPRPLVSLAAQLPNCRVSSWQDAARGAQAVVLIASSALGAIALDQVPAGTLVFDAGHPANGQDALHVRYARAGRVQHEHAIAVDLPSVLDPDGGDRETHACLAEAVVLAYAQRFEPYSKGRGLLSVEQIERIVALAGEHGVAPAPLRWSRC